MEQEMKLPCKSPAEMNKEQLLALYTRRKKEWEEEKKWFIDRSREKNAGRLMKQIQHLLVENNQLHGELEQAREREELWKNILQSCGKLHK